MKPGRFPNKTTLLIILASVLCAAGIWLFLKLILSDGKVRNILLISIDTCRADHLGCYGFPRRTTPNIDQVAREGVLFKNAYSPVPMTLPAHCSMLTGTIPPYHGVHENIDYKLDRSHTTLAEVLFRQGFTTCAAIGAFVLDSRFGLKQGFEYYDEHFKKPVENAEISERRGEEVSSFALEWLEKHRDERFFLFLHYYDPHTWYEPPEPFYSRFEDNLYAGEIAYVDHCIGEVLEKLKTFDMYDSTLLIITGDHGEMLGEHGEIDHKYFIYQSAIKVPLIFKLPGRNNGRKISAPVSIIDILPTVCKMLGVDTPPHVQGKDLSIFFDGTTPCVQDREIYCESLLPTQYRANSLLGVVNGGWKYIQTTRPELYDLSQDPLELNNLFEQQTQRARILQSRLKQILEGSVKSDASDSKKTVDVEGRRRLESLGYLSGSGVSEDFEFNQTKEDPKDLIDFHNMNAEAGRLKFRKRYDEARKICEQMIRERPQDIYAYLHLAEMAGTQGDLTSVVSYLSEAVRLKPDDVKQHNELGNALLQMKKYDEALRHYREALRLDPELAEAHNNIGVTLAALGRVTEAISHLSKAVKIDPDYTDARNNLNIMMERQRMNTDAVRDKVPGSTEEDITD